MGNVRQLANPQAGRRCQVGSPAAFPVKLNAPRQSTKLFFQESFSSNSKTLLAKLANASRQSQKMLLVKLKTLPVKLTNFQVFNLMLRNQKHQQNNALGPMIQLFD